MTAFYIIGMNLQLGFGVNDGIPGEKQILVGLPCVGFLRILVNENLAIEHSMRAASQDPFVQLPTSRSRLQVFYLGMVVNMLFPIDDIKTV